MFLSSILAMSPLYIYSLFKEIYFSCYASIIVMMFLCSNSSVPIIFNWSMEMGKFALWMIIMMFWSSMLINLKFSSQSKLMISAGVVIYLFFSTSSIIVMYSMFELSLIPILYIIYSQGLNPERIRAGMFLLIYTVMASIPLLYSLISISPKIYSLNMPLLSYSFEFSSFMAIGITLAFLVKMPLFLFHSWLPKAHVEAPVEGSVFLAAVMLKMGSFGLIKMMSIISWKSNALFPLMIISLSLIGSIMSAVMILFTDDLKKMVALSSVSHMNFSIASIFLNKIISFKACMIVMISHGLSSMGLFFFVTDVYKSVGSRSLAITKGLVSKSSFMTILSLLLWMGAMGLPPMISFKGEFFSISTLLSLSMLTLIFIFLFMIISSSYSMMCFIYLAHSSHKSVGNIQFSLASGLKLVSCIIPMMLLFFFSESICPQMVM
uniref:NADH-ubiquinone oxidoreductase chain 4 n=1 Tax=Bothriometopus macrocnemis TaxID=475769 RepID=A8VTX0_9NEOP|nr:NADH dehydrogenase subunit 4 [Bothriometopus macrocnemis]ABW20533.1 NADH dehydrogenase subunit 4 [Bothriometopus macrocnemis]UTT72556.1 NADH dehydrogenase subunit 4 [Bothriometopus macrocnemis]